MALTSDTFSSWQVVIASCANDLTWASKLRPLSVLVLEKCPSGAQDIKKSARPLARPAPLPHWIERVDVRPNLGREAHSYLWYITEYWSRLRAVTIFLQGDAPNHRIIPSALVQLASAVPPACLSFLSVVPRAWVTPAWWHEETQLRTYCELWRDFGRGASRECATWRAASHAHFAVNNRTIKQHPLASYLRWRRTFETDAAVSAFGRDHERRVDHPSNETIARFATRGASFFERSWAMLFGCTTIWDGCTFSTNATRQDIAQLPACPDTSFTKSALVGALVPDIEPHATGCIMSHPPAEAASSRAAAFSGRAARSALGPWHAHHTRECFDVFRLGAPTVAVNPVPRARSSALLSSV